MTRLPCRRSDELAADLYCPACVIEAMVAHGAASPAARDMDVEAVLDQCADAMAIDRADETGYDSHELPKPVLLDTLGNDDHCGACHNEP